DVTGIDLSFNSIRHAKQFENHRLHFHVHDMRRLFYINYFDFALNLFTSFGYFKTEKEHISTLQAFRKGLKPGGYLVLDYMNSQKIINALVEKEVKEIDGITFHITRRVEDGKIIKTIDFTHDGHAYSFKEEVRDFNFAAFEKLFKAAGLEIVHTFGDYELNAFEIGRASCREGVWR